jgi:hypothetical protein
MLSGEATHTNLIVFGSNPRSTTLKASMLTTDAMVEDLTVVSVSLHYTNPTMLVDLVQGRPHHHLIEN